MATFGKDFVDIKGGKEFVARLESIAKKLEGGNVKIGFFPGATYPDGTPVALVAAIQNYGAPSRGIPPRPFFSNAIRNNSSGWGKLVAVALKNADMDTEKALTVVGQTIVGQVKDEINNGNFVPLKQSTIDAKGSDKPLIGKYGLLVNKVEYEVTVKSK